MGFAMRADTLKRSSILFLLDSGCSPVAMLLIML
jgi:hypothetical protein